MALQQVRQPIVPPQPRDSQTSQIIVFLAAILSAAATIAGLYAQLPWWFAYSIALFALASVVVLIKEFIWPPIQHQISSSRERKRLDLASEAVFLDFKDLVRRFQGLISTRRNDTLASYVIELRNTDPAWRARLPALPQLIFMFELFTPFSQRLQQWDGTYHQLNALAQEFFTFLRQHDIVYVRDPLNVMRTVKREDLADNVRNKINLLRENYAAFMRDYLTFASRANARFSTKAFVEYFELPEPV